MWGRSDPEEESDMTEAGCFWFQLVMMVSSSPFSFSFSVAHG